MGASFCGKSSILSYLRDLRNKSRTNMTVALTPYTLSTLLKMAMLSPVRARPTVLRPRQAHLGQLGKRAQGQSGSSITSRRVNHRHTFCAVEQSTPHPRFPATHLLLRPSHILKTKAATLPYIASLIASPSSVPLSACQVRLSRNHIATAKLTHFHQDSRHCGLKTSIFFIF